MSRLFVNLPSIDLGVIMLLRQTPIILSMLILTGCDKFGNVSEDTGASSVAKVLAGYGAWDVKDEKDPMSDMQFISARTMIKTNGFIYEATVVCMPNDLRYTLLSFNEDKTTAELRSTTSYVGPIVNFSVRIDGSRPFTEGNIAPRFNNQIEITGDNALNAATADTVTVSLALRNGDDIVKLDQTGAAFRKIKICAENLKGAAAARNNLPQTATVPSLSTNEQGDEAPSSDLSLAADLISNETQDSMQNVD
jgi:hypothetical protein